MRALWNPNIEEPIMNWTPICKLEDIVPNTGVGALVEGRQLAVFRLEDDSVYAIDNYCPNAGANVLSRGIVGDLGSEVCVASPIYKQHYRLIDGACLEDAQASVQAHAAEVKDGVVLVAVIGGEVQAAA